MLDIQQLLPGGQAVEGNGIVRVRENSVAYNIVTGDESAVEIAYVTHNGAETRPCRQRIALVPSWERFAALGSWFKCPSCGRRVEKLYLPSARANFACRRCAGLTYASSQTHDHRVNTLRRDPQRVVDILSGRATATETTYYLALKAAAP